MIYNEIVELAKASKKEAPHLRRFHVNDIVSVLINFAGEPLITFKGEPEWDITPEVAMVADSYFCAKDMFRNMEEQGEMLAFDPDRKAFVTTLA
jgi:hypothetical protein